MSTNIEIPENIRKRLGRSKMAFNALSLATLAYNATRGIGQMAEMGEPDDYWWGYVHAAAWLLAGNLRTNAPHHDKVEWWEERIKEVAAANPSFELPRTTD